MNEFLVALAVMCGPQKKAQFPVQTINCSRAANPKRMTCFVDFELVCGRQIKKKKKIAFAVYKKEI